MRRVLRVAGLLLLFASATLAAQSLVTISPSQCVWRAGYDPTWAAPSLDESGWRLVSTWKLDPSEPYSWIRCHVDSAALDQLADPAIQVRMGAAYEVFLNGAPVAQNGNLESGYFGMDLIRIFTMPRPLVRRDSNLLVLHIARRYDSLLASPAYSAFFALPQFRLGDRLTLRNDRAGFIAEHLPESLLAYAPFVVIGIVGIVVLGFSLYDRTRIAPIVLSAGCIGVGLVFAALLSETLMVNEPAGLYDVLTAVASAISIDAQYWFPFALAGRRVPRVFWLPMGVLILFAAWQIVESLVPLSAALRLGVIGGSMLMPAMNIVEALLGTASLVAFWPWKRVPPAIRPIAALSIAWGVSQSIFFALLFTSLRVIPGLPNVFENWMFEVSTIAQFFVIAAIVALNLRDQRQVALQRAALAGEMQAASAIQRMLAPTCINTAPSLKIGVAFHPMREVGGDFYLCRLLSDGRQRVLLGDVSGKGAAAAMAATLVLGAASARDSDSPSNLLAHLNRVLRENRLSGFATCLCAEVAASGQVSIANAGHLSPYCNGREIELGSGFPLGVAADTEYAETTLYLDLREQLTLLSDGVVEARNKTGELFGFDRTRQISTQSAVGGDFFLTVTRPDNTLVVVIGDVSGKGVGAAMLVAVLVGSARTAARRTSDPAAILSELNLQLLGRSGGHFATCLVGAVTPDGRLNLANAGHLAPYRNSSEIEISGSLPRGLSADTEYAEISLALHPGDALTFLSDGVVEARSASGELFGFDRTRDISSKSAEEVAHAAQAFGQQDDITVLTLTFTPAEVLHA